MLPKTQVNEEICVNLVLPLMFTYIHRQYKSSLKISFTIFIRFPSVQHECSRTCSPGLNVMLWHRIFFVITSMVFVEDQHHRHGLYKCHDATVNCPSNE